MQYRREIDGLRTIAVLPVILFHAGFQIFSGGFVGVDIFFVISGYLITGILIAELDREDFSIIRFYERRARRILPALFFVMLCCIPFAWMWMLPAYFKAFAQSLMAVTLFGSNFLFWKEDNYFAASADLKPLLHTWSLAVEEQYYLLFPIILLILWRFGRQRVFWLILLGAAGSLAMSEWGWRHAATANFYLAPFRAWELLTGSLCAFIAFGRPVRSNNLLSMSGIGLIVLSIFFFDEATPFPSLYALAPVAGTALILLYGNGVTMAARLLSSRPFVGIGLISYSAYLWHQPLFAFARLRSIGHPSQPLMIALSVLALMLAYLSWRFIEQPFRVRNGGLLLGRRGVFCASAVGAAFFIACGFVGNATGGFSSRFSLPQAVQNDLTVRFDEDKCMDITRSRVSKHQDWFCRRGKVGAPRVIGVYGDSHALSFLPALHEWGLKNDFEIRFSAMSSCAPLKGIFVLRNDDFRYDCNARNADAFAPDVVDKLDFAMLIGRWTYYSTGDASGDFRFVGSQFEVPKDRQASSQAFFDHFGSTLRYFAANKVPVIVLHQVPTQRIEPQKAYFMTTLSAGDPDQIIANSSVSAQEYRQAYGPVRRQIEAIVGSMGNQVATVDVADIYCNAHVCPIGSAKRSFYFDDNHLSDYGASLIMPRLGPAMEKAATLP